MYFPQIYVRKTNHTRAEERLVFMIVHYPDYYYSVWSSFGFYVQLAGLAATLINYLRYSRRWKSSAEKDLTGRELFLKQLLAHISMHIGIFALLDHDSFFESGVSRLIAHHPTLKTSLLNMLGREYLFKSIVGTRMLFGLIWLTVVLLIILPKEAKTKKPDWEMVS